MNRIMRNGILLLILLFALRSFSYGQDNDYARFGMATEGHHVPEGLKPGDKAPDFTGYDQTGKQVVLKKMLEKGPAVLVFYRGNWCPVCNKYLTNYQDSLKVIQDMGFSVIAITPESIENVENTVKMHGLTFTVVYDCQEKIMADYDVMFDVTKEYSDKILSVLSADIAAYNGREAARLPVPATFIINKDGIIVAVQFNPDYKNRASVKWMLQNMGRAL